VEIAANNSLNCMGVTCLVSHGGGESPFSAAV